ncbi:MAG: flagellar FlbD family protein [Cyanobacteria bacterium P01_H01_bin.74]
MIEVTRLNGSIYFLNPEMILTIEKTPDTVITLNSGEKLLAKESPEELRRRFIAYKKELFAGPF